MGTKNCPLGSGVRNGVGEGIWRGGTMVFSKFDLCVDRRGWHRCSVTLCKPSRYAGILLKMGVLLVFVVGWVIVVYVFTFSVFTWLNMGCKLSFLSSKQVGSSSVLLEYSSIFSDFSSIYPPKTPSLLHQNRLFRVSAAKPRKRKNVKMNDVWWKIFFFIFFCRAMFHSFPMYMIL